MMTSTGFEPSAILFSFSVLGPRRPLRLWCQKFTRSNLANVADKISLFRVVDIRQKSVNIGATVGRRRRRRRRPTSVRSSLPILVHKNFDKLRFLYTLSATIFNLLRLRGIRTLDLKLGWCRLTHPTPLSSGGGRTYGMFNLWTEPNAFQRYPFSKCIFH